MIRGAIISDIDNLIDIDKQSFVRSERFTRSQFMYPIVSVGKGVIDVSINTSGIIQGYIYTFNNGRIYSLAIHPQYRLGGIASQLLINAESLWEPLGKMYLEVAKNNEPAIRFYLKHGYKYSGIKHNYYSDGMDAIIMKKELSNAER